MIEVPIRGLLEMLESVHGHHWQSGNIAGVEMQPYQHQSSLSMVDIRWQLWSGSLVVPGSVPTSSVLILPCHNHHRQCCGTALCMLWCRFPQLERGVIFDGSCILTRIQLSEVRVRELANLFFQLCLGPMQDQLTPISCISNTLRWRFWIIAPICSSFPLVSRF